MDHWSLKKYGQVSHVTKTWAHYAESNKPATKRQKAYGSPTGAT